MYLLCFFLQMEPSRQSAEPVRACHGSVSPCLHTEVTVLSQHTIKMSQFQVTNLRSFIRHRRVQSFGTSRHELCYFCCFHRYLVPGCQSWCALVLHFLFVDFQNLPVRSAATERACLQSCGHGAHQESVGLVTRYLQALVMTEPHSWEWGSMMNDASYCWQLR